MSKDFDSWNKIKSDIHASAEHHYYSERDVRWCIFGVNVGYEIDGKGETFMRPVLVIKGFSRQMCLCVPVTMLDKTSIFHHTLTLQDGVSRKAILSQVRTIDTKRLTSLIGTVNEGEFLQIKEALIRIIR